MNFSNIYCTPFLKKYFRSLCKDFEFDPVLVDPLAFTAIIVFMSSIDTIDGVKTNKITYKGYLEIFFSSSVIEAITPEKFQNFLVENNWSCDKQIVAYDQLQAVQHLLYGLEYTCDRFVFFDQSSSGVSILALLCNSEYAAFESNAINGDPNIRNCLYTRFLRTLLSKNPTFEKYRFDRKWAKKVVFTHYYGSGLRSVVNATTEWVKNHSMFGKETSTLHTPFNYIFSPEIRIVKKSLRMFCYKIQWLRSFFLKIAFILLCNKKRFNDSKASDLELGAIR